MAAVNGAELDVRILPALAVVLAAAHLCGRVAETLRQPKVIGEITAGILLGPSLLGLVAPSASEMLFGDEVVGALRPIAQVGLLLFMLVVGMELDLEHLRGQGRRAVVISHFSMVVPMLLTVPLALWLHPRFGGGVGRTGFVLFMGAAMAVTALPVLARILRDSGLGSSRIGSLVLTCAAVDDVTVWCVLAGVVAITGASGPADVVEVLIPAALFAAFMVLVVRRLLARAETIPPALAVAFGLASAWITARIGIHAVFGAFLAGAILPGTASSRLALAHRLDTVTSSVLLPAFFAVVGLSTEIGLLDSAGLWGVAALVVVVAIAGKLGGAVLGARLVGEPWADAARIGVLMNTRGLTEIVILTIGLELRVLDRTLFTVMVLMALTTTLMTAPLLARIDRRPTPVPEDEPTLEQQSGS